MLSGCLPACLALPARSARQLVLGVHRAARWLLMGPQRGGRGAHLPRSGQAVHACMHPGFHTQAGCGRLWQAVAGYGKLLWQAAMAGRLWQAAMTSCDMLWGGSAVLPAKLVVLKY